MFNECTYYQLHESDEQDKSAVKETADCGRRERCWIYIAPPHRTPLGLRPPQLPTLSANSRGTLAPILCNGPSTSYRRNRVLRSELTPDITVSNHKK